jgi:hypothetical protein
MFYSRFVFNHRVHRTLFCPPVGRSVCHEMSCPPRTKQDAYLETEHAETTIYIPANTGASASSLVSSRGGAFWLSDWFETLPQAHNYLTYARTINLNVIPLCNMRTHACNKPHVAGSPIRPCNAARGPSFFLYRANVRHVVCSTKTRSTATLHLVYHVYRMHCFVR